MAGRIPQVQQEVAPAGPRVSTPTLGNEADASRGVLAIGQAAAQGAALAERLQAEADTVRITESLVDLERRSNERLLGKTLEPIDAAFEGKQRIEGFLQVQGTRALEASAETRKGLDEDLQEVSEKLLPRQRKLFLEKALQLRASTDRRIEEHVVRESERAKVETLKAAQSETLRAIASDPRGKDWRLRSAMVEESIRALHPDSAEAAVAEWRQQAAVTEVEALLGDGATKAASNALTDNRPWLGTKYDDLKARVDRAQAGDTKTLQNAEATAEVAKWVAEATPPGGYVDAAKVLQRLQSSKPDDPRREALEQEVRQQLQVEHGRRTADVKRHQDVALRADLDGQQVPGATYAFLHEFDPGFLRGLKNEREVRWRRWQAEKDGTEADRAAARRKQAEDDEFLKLKWASLSPEEQAATTPEVFAIVLAVTEPDFSPSRNGYAAAGKVKAETAAKAGKAELANERAYIAEAEREVMAQVTVKGKVNADVAKRGDPRTTISGRAAEQYRSKRAALGREPTPEEVQQWLGELKVQVAIDAGPFSSKKVPAVLDPGFMPGGFGAPKPEAPPKQKTPRQLAQEWLDANPNHPKAAAVRAKLGAMK